MPRILVVEDDADVRLMIEHTLIDAGHQVDTVGTASGALGVLDEHDYDVVVADARLPDGTGMQVADRAAEHGIRPVIITGYAFTLPGDTLRRYEVLLKPLRPIEIVAAVENVLQDGAGTARYLRLKAAHCRQLADGIANQSDPAVVYIRGLADQFHAMAAKMTAKGAKATYPVDRLPSSDADC